MGKENRMISVASQIGFKTSGKLKCSLRQFWLAVSRPLMPFTPLDRSGSFRTVIYRPTHLRS